MRRAAKCTKRRYPDAARNSTPGPSYARLWTIPPIDVFLDTSNFQRNFTLAEEQGYSALSFQCDAAAEQRRRRQYMLDFFLTHWHV